MEGITHKYTSDILIVTFTKEELKLQDAERIIEIVFDLEDSWDIENVILVMEGVTYTNSTVISAIGRIADAKDLRVISMHPKVQAIMDTMGLLPFLEEAPSVEAAIESFDE
ncbi:MAG: STAS domain-containing protein [Planctomycetota bacterium]|jgi:anti-anti-sigma factor